MENNKNIDIAAKNSENKIEDKPQKEKKKKVTRRASLKHLSEEEQEVSNAEMDQLDKNLINNERRHQYKTQRFRLDVLDRDPEEDEPKRFARSLVVFREPEWIDSFSNSPQDLHQMVTDDKLSRAIQMLTKLQKEVLFLNVVHLYSTVEIGIMLGMSDRNVRKHRNRAIEAIRRQLPGLAEQEKKRERQREKEKQASQKKNMWYDLLQILQKG